MDGSTDKGRVENELFVILFSKKDDDIQEIRTCARYFCVLEPTNVEAMLFRFSGKPVNEAELRD